MNKKLLLNLFFTLVLLGSISTFAVNPDQMIIGLRTGEMQLHQAEDALNNGNITAAHQIISTLRPKLSELTEIHSQIFMALKEDTNAKVTADKEKQLTIEYGKLRDQANYLAGQISIKQGNALEAAKHLALVVQSQRSTELGVKAYNMLREIGFSPKLSIQDQI